MDNGIQPLSTLEEEALESLLRYLIDIQERVFREDGSDDEIVYLICDDDDNEMAIYTYIPRESLLVYARGNMHIFALAESMVYD